jgi:hypothetical protein
MGYSYRTNLRCTRPELIASGSTFAQSTYSEIIEKVEDEIHFITRAGDIHEDLKKLSKQHPDVSFTAKTWNDCDFYDRTIWTIVHKNGDYKQIDATPEYVFLGPGEPECDESLSEEMRNKVSHFLDEIKPHTLFSESGDSSQYYGDGLRAYFSFIWETEDHRFIAENKHGYMIQIKYESKDKENLERLRVINKSLRAQLNRKDDEGYDGLPF